jgi:hypothetical protein
LAEVESIDVKTLSAMVGAKGADKAKNCSTFAGLTS